jgi:hypothetical protein
MMMVAVDTWQCQCVDNTHKTSTGKHPQCLFYGYYPCMGGRVVEMVGQFKLRQIVMTSVAGT